MPLIYKGTEIDKLVYKDPKTNKNVNSYRAFKWKEDEKRYIKVFEVKDKPASAIVSPRIYVTWYYNKLPGPFPPPPPPAPPAQYQAVASIMIVDMGDTSWGETFDIELSIGLGRVSTTLSYNDRVYGGTTIYVYSGYKPSSGTVTVKCSDGRTDSFSVRESGFGYSKRFDISLPVAPKVYHPVVESKIYVSPVADLGYGYWNIQSTFTLKNTEEIALKEDLAFYPRFNGEELETLSVENPVVTKFIAEQYFPGTNPGSPPSPFNIEVRGRLYPSEQTKSISQKVSGRGSTENLTFDLEGYYHEETIDITMKTVIKTIKNPDFPNSTDKWITNIESRLVTGFDWPYDPLEIRVRVGGSSQKVTKESPLASFSYKTPGDIMPNPKVEFDVRVGIFASMGYYVEGPNIDELTLFTYPKIDRPV